MNKLLKEKEKTNSHLLKSLLSESDLIELFKLSI